MVNLSPRYLKKRIKSCKTMIQNDPKTTSWDRDAFKGPSKIILSKNIFEDLSKFAQMVEKEEYLTPKFEVTKRGQMSSLRMKP